MTKQQAISLHLAKWLGNNCAMIEHGEVYINDFTGRPFNPFAPTTDGRAQFAECVIKAALDGLAIKMRPAGETPDEYVANRCEAIYYAIGGTNTWSEK